MSSETLVLPVLASLPTTITRLVIIFQLTDIDEDYDPLNCIPHIPRFPNLTHVGGFSWHGSYISRQAARVLTAFSILTMLEAIGFRDLS
ncbi:hypothetical protein M422DRAFT_271080 [Sphaerobolus stellatus SS14]|uniref:Unplaced genomic scaffold SPHSTscaffold_251, whole genome shotgun sequence n=1 Tax=Sphaerobolus stellatus (strain SS14) TaxID=990650 RepID=A0A0C9UQQ4_SPHS4|nr:hypothetical protein M422DRAFT_271080 [Sphaerobolus stellatus SS14]